jgi:hypothetical protein
MQLNRKYSNNETGISIIRDILNLSAYEGENGTYYDLTYQPDFATLGATNINIAFLGAREALKQSANPKACQFVIFFSDGDASGNNYASGLDYRWFMTRTPNSLFMCGTAGISTTGKRQPALIMR